LAAFTGHIIARPLGQTQTPRAADAPIHSRKCAAARLRNRQINDLKFRRQHSIDRFIVDFYCTDAQLVIEVDGPIHEYTPEEDAIRQEFLETLGLRVLRFENDNVLHNIESVIETIYKTVNPPKRDAPDSPSPRMERREGIKALAGSPHPDFSPSPKVR
jgi:very-short-patch-repair endonuclease